MMPSPLGLGKSLESFERKKHLSALVCNFSVSIHIETYIVLCCIMTVFIFSFVYHISPSDVFPELISDLFLLLNPNLKFRLLCDFQARHTTSVFPTYLFLQRERGKFTLIHICAASKWFKCLVCFVRKTFWTTKEKRYHRRENNRKDNFPLSFLSTDYSIKKYAKATKQKDTAVIIGQY